MKSLIVTADDFGASRAVNEAVARAYRDGILRYASLLVKGSAAEGAVRVAKENPGLGVGLHLELCNDRPAAWGLRYFFLPSQRARVGPEIASQIERFLSFGLKPTHVDGHMNIHVHPVIFPVLARLARRYGIPRIRLPGGEALPSLRFDRKGALRGLALAGVFGSLRAALKRHGDGLVIPKTFGLLRSGMMNEDYLIHLIRGLPEGLTEIYLHPTSEPGTEAAGGPTPTHQTVTELGALLSPRVREALREAGVSLAQEPGAPAAGGAGRR